MRKCYAITIADGIVGLCHLWLCLWLSYHTSWLARITDCMATKPTKVTFTYPPKDCHLAPGSIKRVKGVDGEIHLWFPAIKMLRQHTEHSNSSANPAYISFMLRLLKMNPAFR